MNLLHAAGDAAFFLIRVGLVCLVYSFAKFLASRAKCSDVKAYAWTVAVTGLLVSFGWSSYGTHVEDADPIHGGGEIITDFQPTDDQRNEHGVWLLVALLIPSLLGTYRGIKAKDDAALGKNRELHH